MACKLNGLFSIGDDFDEDLLGTEWDLPAVFRPASVAAAVTSANENKSLGTEATASVTSSTLRASSAPHSGLKGISLRQTGETSATLHNATESQNSTQTAIAQTVSPCLRQLSTVQQQLSASSHNSHQQPMQGTSQIHINTNGPQNTLLPQDDFDDWDEVDLADLDERDPQMGVGTHIAQSIQTSAPMATTVSSAKKLRPSNCGRTQSVPSGALRKHNNPSNQTSSCNKPRTTLSTVPFPSPGQHPAFLRPPPQSPAVFSAPSPRPVRAPCQSPRLWETPGRSQQGRSQFEPISPAPSALSSPGLTPVLTNHLVQLVSAANKIPKRRPRSDPNRPKTRRFPGPAGFLPQQSLGQSLDDIVVSIPQTPAHGAVARLPSQEGPSSQSEEEEFSGGPWAMMKGEMGLDERNPLCFLHSYSVVMVLRKAALKQLPKNKVPNMAVVLKSILHTHADAKAVFKDPTGEIQGTVHRHLLEERLGELKAGAVLLLKQVGVFSPSHRNHYLNVTPNNLLRLYPPDGVCLSSAQLSPPALEPVLPSPTRFPSIPGEPVSRMQLVFDEEENGEAGQGPQAPAGSRDESSEAHLGRVDNAALQDPAWGADDDLDELLGELPEETLLL